MVQCWFKCNQTLWETTSANKKESIIRWHISWCPRELIALHEPFLIDWSLCWCFCCFISASSCVRKWEDPHDSVVYCIDSDNKWMVISGTNRYGVVSKICITLWVNGFGAKYMNESWPTFISIFYLWLLPILFSWSLTVDH